MMKELRFAWYAIKKNFQSSSELRTSFLMNVFGMCINNIAFIALWMFFAEAVGNIGGWKPVDVIGLQAFVALHLGVVFAFFGGIQKLPQYVMSGSFDRFMLSPKSVLLRVVTSSMNVSALGDLTFGVVCMVLYAWLIQASLVQVLLMVLMILLGTLSFFAVTVAICSLSFLFLDNTGAVRGIFEFYFAPSLYHGGAFQGVMRFLFTFIVPSLMVGGLPVEIVRDISWQTLAVYAAVLLFWSIFAWVVFHQGLRKYESANFMTFGG